METLSPFDALIEARAALDHVRAEIVKALRAGEADVVAALLRADQDATEALDRALSAYRSH